MNFYKNTVYFISILLLPTVYLHNQELRIIRSGLAPASICKIGLEFFAELNNTSNEDLHVELIPDECCLKRDDEEDCDSLQIIGECVEAIPRETTKTLNLVAPLLDPFERTGYCVIHVDSRPIDRRTKIMRDTLNIQFDTTLKENNSFELKHCENIDENPLNDCKPVNCETYYNGRKSYFDKHNKSCREVPLCFRKRKSNQVYDPKNNKCIDEGTISADDIDFIKSLAGRERHPKEILIINTAKRPQENITSVHAVKQMNVVNETTPYFEGTVLCQSAIVQYLLNNKYTLIVLILVVTVQCCLILTMIYCLSNSSSCCNKKKIVRKFFNYRQDASVTTPLIATSNMDTETTEFDFVSESSNIVHKIKCYKACQKEETANTCMSDDILLKCLNRRDWSAKPKSAIIINDSISPDYYSKPKDLEVVEMNNDNEIEKSESIKTEEYSHRESNSVVSEKEIKCHSYNIPSKADFKAEKEDLKDVSDTTDKGAQACFSNDSLDDFLSERGIMFFGENASKYSFTSSSSRDKSSLTNLTSKTSKNNIIKNVLSYLSKSKVGTASDPGVKKSKSKNLELLHISHASIYSSSSDLKNIKSIKLVKESRSTF